MQSNLIHAFIALVLSSSHIEASQGFLSREDVARMLPYSDEGNAPGEREAFLKLAAYGELAYPALIEELKDSRDGMRIGNIINIFTASKGDKTKPLQAMLQFVEAHGRNEPSFPGIKDVFRGIGLLGGQKEKAILQRYLDLNDTLVRHSVEDSIKLIEKRQETLKRENLAAERRKKGSQQRQLDEELDRQVSSAGQDTSGSNLTRRPIAVALFLVIGILVAGAVILKKKRWFSSS